MLTEPAVWPEGFFDANNIPGPPEAAGPGAKWDPDFKQNFLRADLRDLYAEVM